jgi:hypothetical protein
MADEPPTKISFLTEEELTKLNAGVANKPPYGSLSLTRSIVATPPETRLLLSLAGAMAAMLADRKQASSDELTKQAISLMLLKLLPDMMALCERYGEQPMFTQDMLKDMVK